MNWEQITLGLIFRNEEAKLQSCLDSFRQYADPHCTLILVDNASTDRSPSIAENFLQSWPGPHRLIKRKINSLGGARQDIVETAETEFVYFTDADCEILQNTIPTLWQSLQVSPKAAAVGGIQEFTRRNSFQEELRHLQNKWLFHFGSPQLWKPQKISLVNHVSTCNALYRRNRLLEVGGFRRDLHESAEDLELSLRLRKSYQLLLEPKSLVHHNQCDHWREWSRRAIRNGIWQTELMYWNPRQLLTLRPWLVLGGLMGLLFIPFILIPVYLLLLLNSSRSLVLPWTHLCYAVGGTWGLFRGLRRLKSLSLTRLLFAKEH